METVYRETLQPLLKDGVGVEHSVFPSSTALSTLHCLLLTRSCSSSSNSSKSSFFFASPTPTFFVSFFCDQSKQAPHSSSWMAAVHPSRSLQLLARERNTVFSEKSRSRPQRGERCFLLVECNSRCLCATESYSHFRNTNNENHAM